MRSRARRRSSPTLRPSGEYLMEDFYYAGGLRGLMTPACAASLDLSCRTVSWPHALARRSTDAEVFNDDVIRPLDKPCRREGGIAVLTGSLAPDGAVIKHSAASPALCSIGPGRGLRRP